MKAWLPILLGGTWLMLGATPVPAAALLASPEQDQHAKQAMPPPGKALVYVYRLIDANVKVAPGIWLNNHEAGRLEQNTFGAWAVAPGALEIRGGRFTTPLTIQSEAGQTYFVLLAVTADWNVNLRQMPPTEGRAQMQAARFVLGPGGATPSGAIAVLPGTTPSQEAMTTAATPLDKTAPRTPKYVEEGDAYNITLTFKLGAYLLGDGTQSIASASRQLSTSAMSYGLQGEWRHETDYAVGLEIFQHSLDYTTTASAESGTLDLSYTLLNMKKYFRTAMIAQPYLGVGLGLTTARFSAGSSGGISRTVHSNALQAMAGVVFRFRNFDVYTEYKYLHDEFTLGGTVEATGHGLFAGMSVHF